MNSRKRNKLKGKRTPWIKSRHSAKARALQGAMRSMVLMQGLSSINLIRSAQTSNSFSREAKSMAIASAAMDAMSAVSKVPLYGSKTACQ